MAWSCRSHSPPWSQIGQSSGWLISRNSLTPSRAFFTIGERVEISGGSPLGPGRQSRTPQAQLATGFGPPFTSTRHIRQLPATMSLVIAVSSLSQIAVRRRDAGGFQGCLHPILGDGRICCEIAGLGLVFLAKKRQMRLQG